MAVAASASGAALAGSQFPAGVDLADLSARGDYWIACQPADGTPPEVLRDQLLKVPGVTIYVPVGLPRPLPSMIRTWTRTHKNENLHASPAALTAALASPLQQGLAGYH